MIESFSPQVSFSSDSIVSDVEFESVLFQYNIIIVCFEKGDDMREALKENKYTNR